MNPSLDPFLRWAPRVLCAAFAAFISLFALDAFDPGRALGANLAAFARHLAPTFVLLTLLVVGWRLPKVAGALLILAGCAYAVMPQARQHLSWIAVIAAPMWITGVLFLMSPGVQARQGSN
jgi:hypothetical protein